MTSYATAVGTWSYSYANSGATQTLTITDPNSHTKTYVSNTALDVVTSYKDALNRTTAYGYDGNGRLTSISLPFGDSYSYSYDGRGNVNQVVHTPSGGGTAITTSASYDATCTYVAKCNKPNSTTDGNGHVTSYTYDNTYGVVLTATKPQGANGNQLVTTYSYTNLTAAGQSGPIHLLTGVTYCNTTASCSGTADQTVVTIAYDANHNLAPSSITTAAGNGSISSTQSLSYDAYGNLATSTNPLGGVTGYFYDADRELVGVVGPDPDGSGPRTPAAARVSYTADGLVSETERGTVTTASFANFSAFSANFNSVLQTYDYYDSADRLAQVNQNGSNVANGLVQMAYDNANNLVCTAVRMNPSTFGSEPGQCTLGTVGADGPDRITYRDYNAADQPTALIDGYGSASQRTAQGFTYNTNGTVSILYDGKGNVSCYSYDGFGRTSTVYYANASSGGSCNGSDYDSFGYDASSNLTYHHFRNGSALNYSYDATNLMSSDGTSNDHYDNLGRLLGTNNSSFGWAHNFDALGRVTADYNSYGGGIYSTYDAAGDRTVLTYQGGFYINYDHDLTGAVTAIRESGATSGIGVLASYGFDGLGRVTSVSYGGGVGSDSYSYDSAGRLASYAHAFGGDGSKNLMEGLTYNSANQLRTRTFSNSLYEWASGVNFTNNYTVNGLNQITGTGSSSFSYTGGSLTNDGSNTYGYSIYNQVTSVSGSANAALSYDAGQRLVETTGSSSTLFTYDGAMIAEEQTASNALLRRYVPGPDGTPLVWYEGASNSDRRWLFKDQIGTVQAVMNSSGTSDAVNTYDTYGVPGSANQGRFQFAARPWIPEAGLYDNMARSYSPTLQRFLQTDPTGYADGMNWYAYSHLDPVNGGDPTGKWYDGPGIFSRDNGAGGYDDVGDQDTYDPGGNDLGPQQDNDSPDGSTDVPGVTVTGIHQGPVYTPSEPALSIVNGGSFSGGNILQPIAYNLGKTYAGPWKPGCADIPSGENTVLSTQGGFSVKATSPMSLVPFSEHEGQIIPSVPQSYVSFSLIPQAGQARFGAGVAISNFSPQFQNTPPGNYFIVNGNPDPWNNQGVEVNVCAR